MVRYMKRHKCGLKSVAIKHPIKLTGFTDAAFKSIPEVSTGLALRGLAVVLQEDDPKVSGPGSNSDVANLIDFTVRRQRRVVRSTFSAELNGVVDSVEQLLLLQVTLHQIYMGTSQTPEQMVDMLENGQLYPPLDVSVDARAVYDAVSATDTCEPAGSSLKLHLLSVRNRMESGIIRRLHWVDTRDMLADGLTKGGIDKQLLHQVRNNCRFKVVHEAHTHSKSFPLSVRQLQATSSLRGGARRRLEKRRVPKVGRTVAS